MSVNAYILIQTEVGKAAVGRRGDRRARRRHQRRGRHRPVRRHRARRGRDRRRARQARRRQRPGGRRHHPHADLPGRAPLGPELAIDPDDPPRGADRHRRHRARSSSSSACCSAAPARSPAARHRPRRARCCPPSASAPPPDTSGATVSTCAQVISALPLRLAGLDLRRTDLEPAVLVDRGLGRSGRSCCGAASRGRATSSPALSAELFEVDGGAACLPAQDRRRPRRSPSIDRAVYLDVTVPSSYGQPPLGPISRRDREGAARRCACRRPDGRPGTAVHPPQA